MTTTVSTRPSSGTIIASGTALASIGLAGLFVSITNATPLTLSAVVGITLIPVAAALTTASIAEVVA